LLFKAFLILNTLSEPKTYPKSSGSCQEDLLEFEADVLIFVIKKTSRMFGVDAVP